MTLPHRLPFRPNDVRLVMDRLRKMTPQPSNTLRTVKHTWGWMTERWEERWSPDSTFPPAAHRYVSRQCRSQWLKMQRIMEEMVRWLRVRASAGAVVAKRSRKPATRETPLGTRRVRQSPRPSSGLALVTSDRMRSGATNSPLLVVEIVFNLKSDARPPSQPSLRVIPDPQRKRHVVSLSTPNSLY